MLATLLAALLLQPASERQWMLTGFDRVRVDGPYAVTITTGSGASARAAGDPKALEQVQLRVEGNTLIVQPLRDDRGRPATAAPAIIVTTPRVAAISLRGGGTVRLDRARASRVDLALTGDGTIEVGEVDAEQLTLTLLGAGRAVLAGRTGRARIMVNGAGSIAADALDVGDLLVQMSGTGDGRYRARYTADIAASGSGSVTVGGTPRCRTRGTATIRCS
ncbi:head GIN domain-containing protein [Sphingomonas sp. Leaf25]|uniref:head GIN domain-containing protein n=1 Tax=Sphingomonas sp. Leaf25 TaxID=1735692 RepID=UPI000701F72A|nr:head GIN domain-containing protein [Sphingomonas sp. Leaf25]KQM96386.1 hypothetical protein ASE78_10125 [Sphingomonas sp. Leaf25]